VLTPIEEDREEEFARREREAIQEADGIPSDDN